MGKVTPFLWFDDQAEDAAKFYVSVFKNSKITHVSRADEGPDAKAMFVTFELDGVPFHALNGGPHFTLSPAFSMFVRCEDQREVDDLWERLSAGGEKSRCGWLVDKFGVSWQVIPTALTEMLDDADDAKSERVREAMLKMDKIDIAGLKRAYNG